MWLTKYFEEIGLPVARSIVIYVDNNRAISLSTNDKNYCQTKHIDIQHHFVKKQTKAEDINFKYILSMLNLADFLTKPPPREAL